jgi:TonB family protein
LLVLLTLVVPATVQAEVWQPAGKWTVDFGDATCLLGRVFAAGERKLTIAFETKPPSPQFKLVLAGQDRLFSGVSGPRNPISVSVPGGTPIIADIRSLVDFSTGGSRARIELDSAVMAGLITAREISIEGAGSNLTIATGGSAGAANALRLCEEDLYKRWKVDPREFDGLAALPTSTGMTLSADDYPLGAIRDQEQGLTIVLVRIDEKGTIGQCRVVVRSSAALLDRTTCDLLRLRASYSPAIGKDGRPKATWARYDLHWVLPRD